MNTLNQCLPANTEYKNPSALERLKDRQQRLENDLKKINKAILILEKNKDVAEIIEALQICY